MSWAQNNSAGLRAGLAGAFLTGLVGAGAALAAPAIVVKSTSDDYPVGDKVDDEATITLSDGETVSVLTRRGSRTMKGPGTFVVGANPKSNRSRFTNLKRRGASMRSDAGAVRGASPGDDGRPLNPKIFYVDATRSERVCLSDTSSVALWRPFVDKPATYIVNGAGLDSPVAVAFVKGQDVGPPEEAPLALTGGMTYTITGGETGQGTAMTIASVTIVDLGQDYARADELAQALFENGCMKQFNTLSARLVPEG